jgi:hypothetical protein
MVASVIGVLGLSALGLSARMSTASAIRRHSAEVED